MKVLVLQWRILPALFCLCIGISLTACGGGASTRAVSASVPESKAAPVHPASGTAGTGATVSGERADQSASTASAEQSTSTSPATQTGAASPANATQTPQGKPTAASRVSADLTGAYSLPGGGRVAQCWLPLVRRLEADPRSTPEVIRYFCNLPEYSPTPMGVKVKELFTSAFLRKKKPDDGKPKAPPSRIYRNVVTAASLTRCADFLAANKDLFNRVEKKYPVPREILVSLLYVETRLGTYVGKDNAFWSLACMAAADSPDRVRGGLEGIPINDKHQGWLQGKLADKSDWAYKELRALLEFCVVNELNPHLMPGSVYGAIGICQFMPSNLTAYADDGDGDGVINLFSEADAVFSAARYLTKHGWKENMGVDAQRAVLKRYNNLNIYANTILALAESVRTGVVQTGPPK